MKVGLLTENQKDLLVGTLLKNDWFFNPVLDGNNDWIISQEEMNNNTNPDCAWVSNLPLVDWVAPPPTNP